MASRRVSTYGDFESEGTRTDEVEFRQENRPCAVLCQLAYNHAIMDLRAYKETLNSLKTPMQGVFVVVLCAVAFVVWLGVLVVITKLLMG